MTMLRSRCPSCARILSDARPALELDSMVSSRFTNTTNLPDDVILFLTIDPLPNVFFRLA